MGHALDNTMQDILIRYKRMQGYEALWQPGTDHASIATEVKIINKLKEEGISAGLLDMYCVKPLDREGLVKAAEKAKVVISIEEHAPFGGLGSMVSQVVGAECPRKVVNMALPDAPVITGTSKEVFDYYGLNAEGIVKKAKELLA